VLVVGRTRPNGAVDRAPERYVLEPGRSSRPKGSACSPTRRQEAYLGDGVIRPGILTARQLRAPRLDRTGRLPPRRSMLSRRVSARRFRAAYVFGFSVVCPLPALARRPGRLADRCRCRRPARRVIVIARAGDDLRVFGSLPRTEPGGRRPRGPPPTPCSPGTAHLRSARTTALPCRAHLVRNWPAGTVSATVWPTASRTACPVPTTGTGGRRRRWRPDWSTTSLRWRCSSASNAISVKRRILPSSGTDIDRRPLGRVRAGDNGPPC